MRCVTRVSTPKYPKTQQIQGVTVNDSVHLCQSQEEEETGLIQSIDRVLTEGHCKRLREMGFQEGETITCLKTLPFKGPGVFQVRDGVFSLEESVANRILIQKV